MTSTKTTRNTLRYHGKAAVGMLSTIQSFSPHSGPFLQVSHTSTFPPNALTNLGLFPPQQKRGQFSGLKSPGADCITVAFGGSIYPLSQGLKAYLNEQESLRHLQQAHCMWLLLKVSIRADTTSHSTYCIYWSQAQINKSYNQKLMLLTNSWREKILRRKLPFCWMMIQLHEVKIFTLT